MKLSQAPNEIFLDGRVGGEGHACNVIRKYQRRTTKCTKHYLPRHGGIVRGNDAVISRLQENGDGWAASVALAFSGDTMLPRVRASRAAQAGPAPCPASRAGYRIDTVEANEHDMWRAGVVKVVASAALVWEGKLLVGSSQRVRGTPFLFKADQQQDRLISPDVSL